MEAVHGKLLAFSLMVSAVLALITDRKVTFSLRPRCTELFYFNYLMNLEEGLHRVYYQSYIGDVTVKNGKAHLNGTGRLEIPYFNGNGFLGSFAMAFKFKAKILYTHSEIGILGNGQSANTTNLLVSYIHSSLLLKVKIYKYKRGMLVSREIKLEIPQMYFVLETQVRLALSYGILMFQANSSPVVASRLESGEHLLPARYNLSIGQAGGLPPFRGTIDDFIFYTCIPPDYFTKLTWP